LKNAIITLMKHEKSELIVYENFIALYQA